MDLGAGGKQEPNLTKQLLCHVHAADKAKRPVWYNLP